MCREPCCGLCLSPEGRQGGDRGCKPIVITIPCKNSLCQKCLTNLRRLANGVCLCSAPVSSLGPDGDKIRDVVQAPVVATPCPSLPDSNRGRDTSLNREKCRISYAENPSLIYVRATTEPMYEELELSRKLKRLKLADHSKPTSKSVIVRYKHANHRGHLLSELESPVARVRLVDKGEVVRVAAEGNVADLPTELAKCPALCFPVKLAGISPAGSRRGEWSISAIEKMKEIIASHYDSIYISPKLVMSSVGASAVVVYNILYICSKNRYKILMESKSSALTYSLPNHRPILSLTVLK